MKGIRKTVKWKSRVYLIILSTRLQVEAVFGLCSVNVKTDSVRNLVMLNNFSMCYFF